MRRINPHDSSPPPAARGRPLGSEPAADAPWRRRLHEVIFEADTRAGRIFDVLLLWVITLSIVAVCLESVAAVQLQYGAKLRTIEWVVTGLFTVEYVLRLLAVQRPMAYARSFFGIVDLLALLPTYLSLLVGGAQALVVIRAIRLLRIFRVLKLVRFLGEARLLQAAMRASLRKITVFIITVLATVLIAGALMYVLEGPEHGFTSIPISMYWAIVTMTTVGFGDIVPATTIGRFLASGLMILGYGIIAVPTGIVSVELAEAVRNASNTQACPSCGREGHANDARFCKYCGSQL
jgi:voltage-gated potassium channel